MGSAGASEPSKVAAEATVVKTEVRGEEEKETAMVLSREDVLRRRRRSAEQLAEYYRNEYWGLMEEVRVRHRDYYWEYGKSPFEDEDYGDVDDEAVGGGWGCGGGTVSTGERGEEVRVRVRFGEEVEKKGERGRCAFAGCKSKAMPLTQFCHSHILSDNEQTLYKPCIYVIKNSPHTGPIYCQKPVLRDSIPLLCPTHFQKYQKNISQALKKVGRNVSSTNKPAPKIHVIFAEYVNQIQDKRRRLSGQSST